MNELEEIEKNKFIELILTILHSVYNIKAYKIGNYNHIFLYDRVYCVSYEINEMDDTEVIIDKNASFYVNVKKIWGKHYVLKIYKNRNTIFEKVKRFILINDKMPSEKDNKKLYEYVKEYVLAYREGLLSEKIIEKFEDIQYWEWNYEHLTKDGVIKDRIINLLINKIPLNNKEIKIYRSMLVDYKKKLLDQYFVKRLLLYKNLVTRVTK